MAFVAFVPLDAFDGEEREMSVEKMKISGKRSVTRKRTSTGVAKTQLLKEAEKYIEGRDDTDAARC